MNRWKTMRNFFAERRILLGIIGVVTVALIMTVISVWVYNLSDVARLDISRPGYEQARQSVIKGNETQQFSATGELDKDALDTFERLFDERLKALQAIGKFDGNSMSDDQLKLFVQ